MKAFVRQLGVSQLQSVEIPKAISANHVLVKNEFAGVNFLDIYYRDGLYPLKDGAILGAEAAGRVVECADSLKSQWLNKRVVFYDIGGFAEYTAVPVSRLIPVPDEVSLQKALALTVMGLTAHYLCCSTHKVSKGDHVLVHAAGSGTGHMIAQIAANVFKADVVATCSTKKIPNVPLPRDKVVDYSGFSSDLVGKLRAFTPQNRGFDVIYDGVGKSTYEISLDTARQRGLCVFFGNASGKVPPIDILTLSAKGSLFVTRPKLMDYTTTHEELLERAKDLFEWLSSGLINVALDKEFDSIEETNEALNYVKDGHAQGKVVIKIKGSNL